MIQFPLWIIICCTVVINIYKFDTWWWCFIFLMACLHSLSVYHSMLYLKWLTCFKQQLKGWFSCFVCSIKSYRFSSKKIYDICSSKCYDFVFHLLSLLSAVAYRIWGWNHCAVGPPGQEGWLQNLLWWGSLHPSFNTLTETALMWHFISKEILKNKHERQLLKRMSEFISYTLWVLFSLEVKKTNTHLNWQCN